MWPRGRVHRLDRPLTREPLPADRPVTDWMRIGDPTTSSTIAFGRDELRGVLYTSVRDDVLHGVARGVAAHVGGVIGEAVAVVVERVRALGWWRWIGLVIVGG